MNEDDHFQVELQQLQNLLKEARGIGDRDCEGGALTNLGSLYASVEQYDRAFELYHQGLTIFQDLGNLRNQVWVLNNMGSAHCHLAQYDRAIAAYQNAIVAAQLAGRLVREGWVWRNLGHAYREISQYEKAIESFQRAVQVFRARGSREEEMQVIDLIEEAQQERYQR